MPSVPQRSPTVSSIRRSSTEGYGRNSAELSRRASTREKTEQTQADASVPALKAELSDLQNSSGWWIKNSVPDSLVSKVGNDLIYEVDTHKIAKRGNREIIYKDYYVLFHDLSQIVIELQYHGDDPRYTVIINDLVVKGASAVRKDSLHRLNATFGNDAAEIALKYLGTKVASGIVLDVFEKLHKKHPDVLGPIGEKAFGATIYKNQNSSVSKVEEIRPGDILCAKSAKFASHKGLKGLGNKSVVLGDGSEVYAAVIVEYDPRKDKVKVLENDRSGIVRRESYKFEELKSGRLRVFRIVDRNYVGW